MWLGHKRCTPLKGYRPKMTRLLSDTFCGSCDPKFCPQLAVGFPILCWQPLPLWMSGKCRGRAQQSSACGNCWVGIRNGPRHLDWNMTQQQVGEVMKRKIVKGKWQEWWGMMRNDERSRYLMLFPKSLQHAEHCSLLQRIIYFGQVIESGVTGPTCLQCAKHFHCLHEKSYHLSVFLGHALKLSSPMYPMIHTGS